MYPLLHWQRKLPFVFNAKLRQLLSVAIRHSFGLENSWYEIQYGEVKLTNHCMLNCLRKECIHCCIDSGNFRSCSMQSWEQLLSVAIRHSFGLENSWYEIQYGEVKLTNHCMLNCLRKECIHCCIDSGNFRSCWMQSWEQLLSVAIRHSFTSGK